MEVTVESFFERTYENVTTEAMLGYNFVFSKTEVMDYVQKVISLPYQDYIQYIAENICTQRIESSSQIPQISNYYISTFGVCKMLAAIDDPGVSVLEFGRFLYPGDDSNIGYKEIEAVSDEKIKNFLQDNGLHIDSKLQTMLCLDGKERKKGAIVKIAENQLKGSEFHGLVYELGGKWFLTCLGRLYPTLDEWQQHALSARTLLRSPLFWRVVAEAKNIDVDFSPYVRSVCSSTTANRRLSSCQHFFDIITEQCSIEGVDIHNIYFSKESKKETKQTTDLEMLIDFSTF